MDDVHSSALPFPSASFGGGKYWLKRARLPSVRLPPPLPVPPDGEGFCLCDVRIECGAVRAVLPAGEAPCCCRGVDLDGARVCPLDPDALMAPGQPADLAIDGGPGRRVRLRAGIIEASGPYAVACVCTPPRCGPARR